MAQWKILGSAGVVLGVTAAFASSAIASTSHDDASLPSTDVESTPTSVPVETAATNIEESLKDFEEAAQKQKDEEAKTAASAAREYAQAVAKEAEEAVKAEEVAKEQEKKVQDAVELQKPKTINVTCNGTQAQIDTCEGATNYKPVSDYLGVPYYAQHNVKGGNAWLLFEVGDRVTIGRTTYTIAAIRTVTTGGSVEQIKGMGGDAYLQTCLDDNQHSKVYSLKKN
ncbi:MAG: hypothetical protein J6M18_03090 [Actinomycetaceae bacterium]|nr:hypothetical protein [Actinomycetaceae bacterium]